MTLIPYFVVGGAFGFILVESEVVSWVRIQEMFRLDAFHMYGIIGAAVATAALSLLVIRRMGLRAADGTPLGFAPKQLGSARRYAIGGAVFGLGWALTGSCPGPMVALVGAGVPAMLVTIASALAGTWTYGWLRPRLPH
jgi:uncharacterized membrane protein YedE/YeeE